MTDNDYIRKAVELAAPRFWGNVKIGKTDNSCHEWLAHRNSKGYGRLNVAGKNIMAHRFAWILKYGEIPDDKIICHRCDNPSCVNWRHLWIGTHADNIRDRDSKGRHKPHSRVQYQEMQKLCAKKKRKLSEIDVRNIRSCDTDGVTLAKQYELTKSMISLIRTRKNYADVR